MGRRFLEKKAAPVIRGRLFCVHLPTTAHRSVQQIWVSNADERTVRRMLVVAAAVAIFLVVTDLRELPFGKKAGATGTFRKPI